MQFSAEQNFRAKAEKKQNHAYQHIAWSSQRTFFAAKKRHHQNLSEPENENTPICMDLKLHCTYDVPGTNYTHEHFLLPRFLYFCCWFLILQNHHRIKLIIIRSQPKERKDNTIQHSTASWRTNPSPPPLTTTLGNRRKDINQYGLYLPQSFFSD